MLPKSKTSIANQWTKWEFFTPEPAPVPFWWRHLCSWSLDENVFGKQKYGTSPASKTANTCYWYAIILTIFFIFKTYKVNACWQYVVLIKFCSLQCALWGGSWIMSWWYSTGRGDPPCTKCAPVALFFETKDPLVSYLIRICWRKVTISVFLMTQIWKTWWLTQIANHLT